MHLRSACSEPPYPAIGEAQKWKGNHKDTAFVHRERKRKPPPCEAKVASWIKEWEAQWFSHSVSPDRTGRKATGKAPRHPGYRLSLNCHLRCDEAREESPGAGTRGTWRAPHSASSYLVSPRSFPPSRLDIKRVGTKGDLTKPRKQSSVGPQ